MRIPGQKVISNEGTGAGVWTISAGKEMPALVEKAAGLAGAAAERAAGLTGGGLS